MNKWYMTIVGVLLFFMIPSLATADDDWDHDMGEMNRLVSEWNGDGYPNDVGHVYIDDNTEKIYIGLMNDDESVKEKIESEVGSHDFLEFESTTYTHNELMSIMEEIFEEEDDNPDVRSVWVDQETEDGKKFGESNHEERVLVIVEGEKKNEYTEKFKDKYGNRVYVEDEDNENTAPEPEDEVAGDDYSIEMEELIQEWELEGDSDIISPGYPDNIGHTFMDDKAEKVIVGLVDNNNAARGEIRSMVDSPEYLEFESSTYSYNDLITIFQKLSEEAEEDDHLYGVGIGFKTNDNQEVVGFGESGHESRVTVDVDESVVDEYKEDFAETYGDKVYVEASDFPSEDATDSTENSAGNDSQDDEDIALGDNDETTAEKTQKNIWLFMYLVAIIASLVFVAYMKFRSKRHTAVRQTTTGVNVTEHKLMSRRKAITAIKESKIKPSDEVDRGILDEIEKKTE